MRVKLRPQTCPVRVTGPGLVPQSQTCASPEGMQLITRAKSEPLQPHLQSNKGTWLDHGALPTAVSVSDKAVSAITVMSL